MRFMSASKKGAAFVLVGLMLVAFLPMASTNSQGLVLQVIHWDQGTDMPTNLSQSVVIEAGNGLIYAFGGQSIGTDIPSAESWMYNTASGEWSRLSDMVYPMRGAAGALGPDGRIYLFGGYDGLGKSAKIQVYHPNMDVWTASYPDLQNAVWEAKAIYSPSDDRFYVVGGEVVTAGSNSVQYVGGDLSWTGKYSSGDGLLPFLRMGGSLIEAPSPGHFWYIGGATSGYDVLGNAVLEFDPLAPAWSVVTILPYNFVAGGAVRGADGMYYVYGGAGSAVNYGPAYDTGAYYDPYQKEWGSLPMQLFQATKYFGAAATSDGRIWAIGGNNGTSPDAMVPEVQSLTVMTTTLDVPAEVKTGEPFMAKVSVWAPFSSVDRFDAQAYVSDSYGTSYALKVVYSPSNAPFAFDFTVPMGATSGNYTFHLINNEVFALDAFEMPGLTAKLVVVSQAPLSDQIAALEAQIAALQDQVGDQSDQIATLQEELSTLKGESTKLQSSVDNKADSMLSYLTIVLLVVIVALVALMMARRKA